MCWCSHRFNYTNFSLKTSTTEPSGGQQQRVAIARAIVGDPVLLACDEPTGDLDRESADQVLELLQILNSDRGKTIVMVTHDPHAANHASRRLHLDKGRLGGDLHQGHDRRRLQ